MSSHLQFNRYSSIENAYQTPFLYKVKEKVSSDILWDVTEKVHGANCSFITDGNNIEFAKRSGIVGNGETFYNYETVYNENAMKILNAFYYIKENFEFGKSVKLVQFYGELFGGAYPHPDVLRDSKFSSVQKGVYYSPKQHFYGFDIAVVFDNDARIWLSDDQIVKIYKNNDIFYAKILFRGTLEECLNYSNEFSTTIPSLLGLPDIEDNTCEGVVIRPIIPQFLNNGDRILIKNKNSKFSEKKKEKVHKEIPVFSEEVQEMMRTLCTYVNDNRLCNIISHEGEFDMPRDFGKLMKLFTTDVLDDFIKEHEVEWYNLTKEYQKACTKVMSGEAANVIKSHYGIR